ncbi:MAG: hypothetical protein AAF615_06245, partial [Pseudomonadota bacterium]
MSTAATHTVLRGPFAWLREQVAEDADHGRFRLLLPVFGALGIWLCAIAPFEPSTTWLAAGTLVFLILRVVVMRDPRTAVLGPV